MNKNKTKSLKDIYQPLLSLVVPVYNAACYLDKCIESLVKQSYKNIEIILVNDGSKDDSLLICNSYAKKFKNISVIDTENGGAAHARNIGLRIAKGEYLTFVDSDDYVDLQMYEILVKEIIKTQSDVCVCGRFDVCDGKINEGLCPNKCEILSGKETLNRCFIYDNVDFAPWDKIYKREIFSDVSFPEGRICEDVMALYQVFLKCTKVCFVNQRLYYYVHHAGSASTVQYNKHTYDFEHFAGIILKDVKEKHLELLHNCEIFRMKSILYVTSYAGKVPHRIYKEIKAKLYSYKGELQNYKHLMNKRQKRIFYAYKFHLARFHYYFYWKNHEQHIY